MPLGWMVQTTSACSRSVVRVRSQSERRTSRWAGERRPRERSTMWDGSSPILAFIILARAHPTRTPCLPVLTGFTMIIATGGPMALGRTRRLAQTRSGPPNGRRGQGLVSRERLAFPIARGTGWRLLPVDRQAPPEERLPSRLAYAVRVILHLHSPGPDDPSAASLAGPVGESTEEDPRWCEKGCGREDASSIQQWSRRSKNGRRPAEGGPRIPWRWGLVRLIPITRALTASNGSGQGRWWSWTNGGRCDGGGSADGERRAATGWRGSGRGSTCGPVSDRSEPPVRSATSATSAAHSSLSLSLSRPVRNTYAWWPVLFSTASEI